MKTQNTNVLGNDSVHYTRFGVSMQPREAASDGYLIYRVGFESLPPDEWTDAESWIYAQEAAICAWRSRQD